MQDAEAARSIIFSESWKQQQTVLRGFWKQYCCEYLQYPRSLHYVNPQGSRPLRIGQVCILQSHEQSRAHWPLRRVVELCGGEATDKRRRFSKILTAQEQIFSRLTQLLDVEQF